MPADSNMIVFDKVTKTYGKTQKALDGVSLQIDKGEFAFPSGNSGVGKTTLLELVLRNARPDKGDIWVNGIGLGSLRECQAYQYRRYIGMVSQDFRLFQDLTMYKNVAFAQRVIEAEKKKVRSRVREVLRQVGLEDKAGCYPGQLSGGEQQRTASARAVVNQPVLLLTDRLTGNLDQRNAEEIIRLLEKVNRQETTVLAVTHNRELVKHMYRRQIMLSCDRIARDLAREGLVYAR